MHHFEYIEGELRCEEARVRDIARRFGTPVYIYSSATLTEHFLRTVRAFESLRPTICFSVKCCQNIHVLRLLADLGSAFDVVSGGELFRVLQAGGNPQRVVYAGVGKQPHEMTAAIEAGIGLFNIESTQELQVLADLAERRRVAVRAAIRINPDVDAQTHRYTTTGKKENKFGIDADEAAACFARYRDHAFLRLAGLHLHIGSPVNSPEPYVDAIRCGLQLIDRLRGQGHAIDVLDIGGGFGAHYRNEEAPSAADYARHIVPLLAGKGLNVILEPGRSIAANAGILVTQTLFTKATPSRRFVIVDAGMNDLIRPALYDAYHHIWPVITDRAFIPTDSAGATDEADGEIVDIVGPICESGDFLGKARKLPPVHAGDLLAVFSAGAYGMTMASQYNSRPRPPEVLVRGQQVRLIRRRETYEDLIACEREQETDLENGGES